MRMDIKALRCRVLQVLMGGAEAGAREEDGTVMSFGGGGPINVGSLVCRTTMES